MWPSLPSPLVQCPVHRVQRGGAGAGLAGADTGAIKAIYYIDQQSPKIVINLGYT